MLQEHLATSNAQQRRLLEPRADENTRSAFTIDWVRSKNASGQALLLIPDACLGPGQ
jgi:hypothetical protein